VSLNGAVSRACWGAALAAHPDVDKIGIPGSYAHRKKNYGGCSKGQLKEGVLASGRCPSATIEITASIGLPGTWWQISSPCI